MKTCGTCAESKNHECRNVFCVEYGIVINRNHPRCRYGRDKHGSGDDDVNRLPDKQPHDSSPR